MIYVGRLDVVVELDLCCQGLVRVRLLLVEGCRYDLVGFLVVKLGCIVLVEVLCDDADEDDNGGVSL